jgi:hypothetical protein
MAALIEGELQGMTLQQEHSLSPLSSHLSSTRAMYNTAGKVHDCFSVVTGLRFRQQWFNNI